MRAKSDRLLDYSVGQPDIARRVVDPEEGFRGYAVEHEEPVEEGALRPGGWSAHVEPSEVGGSAYGFASVTPFAWLVCLRREADCDDAHGPKRLAVLFVGGDGFATFDALYCQGDGAPPPYLVVAKDHGFGGNWDAFGEGGLLERLATNAERRPKYLFAWGNARPWAGCEHTGAEGLYVLPRGWERDG